MSKVPYIILMFYGQKKSLLDKQEKTCQKQHRKHQEKANAV